MKHVVQIATTKTKLSESFPVCYDLLFTVTFYKNVHLTLRAIKLISY